MSADPATSSHSPQRLKLYTCDEYEMSRGSRIRKGGLREEKQHQEQEQDPGALFLSSPFHDVADALASGEGDQMPMPTCQVVAVE